jgi:hypothetical protein
MRMQRCCAFWSTILESHFSGNLARSGMGATRLEQRGPYWLDSRVYSFCLSFVYLVRLFICLSFCLLMVLTTKITSPVWYILWHMDCQPPLECPTFSCDTLRVTAM